MTAIGLAVIGAVWDTGLSIAVIASIPLVVASVALCSALDRDQRLGLVDLLLIALMLRWVVSAGVQLLLYRERPGFFGPDEGGYHLWAQDLARQLAGHPSMPDEPTLGARGLLWTAAASYHLLGVHLLVPKFLNCLLGAWTAVLTALLAGFVFRSPAVARRAGLLAAVFPSLVLWSGLLLKDVWTLFGAQLVLLGFMHLRERFRVPALAALLLGLFLIGINRPYEVMFVSLSLLASFAFGATRHVVRNLVLFALFSVIVMFAIERSGAMTQILGESGHTMMEQVAHFRRVYSEGPGTGSAVDVALVDTSTPLGLLTWLPLGLVFFFLAPIPFTGSSLSLTSSPEMIVWYFLLPSAFRGLRSLVRGPSKAFWPILLYVIIATVGWATAITNVGAMYRYRSQVLFCPLMLIAADQIRRRDEREKARVAAMALRARAHKPALPEAGTT
ncbi:MAG: hypothetical protein HY828_09775 [Actinobacteria bacterium]|nr:hypothetical protein [Actinomycetota bacterium]